MNDRTVKTEQRHKLKIQQDNPVPTEAYKHPFNICAPAPDSVAAGSSDAILKNPAHNPDNIKEKKAGIMAMEMISFIVE